MELITRRIGKYSVMKLLNGNGKIDLINKDEFEILIHSNLDLENPHIIFDFAHIKKVDNDIIGSITVLLQKLLRRGGSVGFLNISDEFKNLLLITKLFTFFNVFKSEEEIPEKFDYSIENDYIFN